MTATRLVLASGSESRARLLEHAGVPFVTQPARVDEDAVKAGMRSEGASARDVAQALADLKANRVSPSWPETFVVGADQILECDGAWYDKPADLVAARDQLESLAGRTHVLHTAAAVGKDGAVLWRHATRARLAMRPLTPGFIDSYLAAEGDLVLGSVGAYRIEGRGVQLFADISGDFFSILGLPLLALLDFLRGHGVVGR